MSPMRPAAGWVFSTGQDDGVVCAPRSGPSPVSGQFATEFALLEGCSWWLEGFVRVRTAAEMSAEQHPAALEGAELNLEEPGLQGEIPVLAPSWSPAHGWEQDSGFGFCPFWEATV